jgi:thymidine phosphorylase
VLKGKGPADLTRLSLRLTAHMLLVGGLVQTLDDGLRRVEEELRTGRGLDKFVEIVKAQGGNPSVVEGAGLPRSRFSKVVTAARDGFVARIDTEGVGTAAMLLGAGRLRVEDAIDSGAGLVVHKKVGDEVRRGDPLVTLQYNDVARLADAEHRILQSYTLSDEAPRERPELVIEVIEGGRNP